MPRLHISRGQLSFILEAWLEQNGGGSIRYWDVDDDGAFRGVVVEGVNKSTIDELPSNGDD